MKIDFREKLTLYFENVIKFIGFIILVKPINDQSTCYEVVCEDDLRLVKNYKTSLQNLHQELSEQTAPDYLALLADILKMKHSIDGVNNDQRSFDVINPIKDLTISENIEIGSCTLTNNIPEIHFFQETDYMKQFQTFAHIKITAPSYYDAIVYGKEIIQDSINILNFRERIPTLINNQPYYRHITEAQLADVIYVKDLVYLSNACSNPTDKIGLL